MLGDDPCDVLDVWRDDLAPAQAGRGEHVSKWRHDATRARRQLDEVPPGESVLLDQVDHPALCYGSARFDQVEDER